MRSAVARVRFAVVTPDIAALMLPSDSRHAPPTLTSHACSPAMTLIPLPRRLSAAIDIHAYATIIQTHRHHSDVHCRRRPMSSPMTTFITPPDDYLTATTSTPSPAVERAQDNSSEQAHMFEREFSAYAAPEGDSVCSHACSERYAQSAQERGGACY